MGSGSSKNKPVASENKTNNSGSSGVNSFASPKQDTPVKQVPPVDEKGPAKSTTNAVKETKTEDKTDNKENASSTNQQKPPPPGETDKAKDQPPESEEKVSSKPEEKTEEMKASEAEGKAKGSVQPEKIIDEGPKEQLKFDCALRSACLLVKPDSLYKHITKNVTKLHLTRALPLQFNLTTLLTKFDNLKDLDLSFNNMGPQSFRAVCLAMCSNNSILSLNLSDNKADTDSADCIGRLLEENKTLQYLDVSSNYLGKDYFSRKVGPALKTNVSLKTLRCEGVGTTDARLLMEGLQCNTTITELDVSNNPLSDPTTFCKGLADCFSKAECVLCTVNLSRCELNPAAAAHIQKGLSQNKSLQELNLTACQMESQGDLLQLVVTAVKHPCMRILSLDSTRCKSSEVSTDAIQVESPSSLEVLSVSDCGLVDSFFTSLEKSCKGKLLSLTEIDLTANKNLTTGCLGCLVNITSDDELPSCLRRLRYGLNKGDGLSVKLRELPSLQYFNMRLCHISQEELAGISSYVSEGSCHLSTIILDGLKLSGTSVLQQMLANPKTIKLTTLSVGGCSLDDGDLSPLCDAFKSSIQLSMLKLSANRITDVGVASLVEAILKNKACPLSVLDLSNNRLEDGGAKTLVKLFSSKSQLHSLNVSSNNIGKEGLLALVSVVAGKSPLQVLHVHGQGSSVSSLDEGHMVEIYTKLATGLGYKLQYEGEAVKSGCCDLPGNLPEALLVNLTNMGGHSGSVGQAIDSRCILTDFIQDRLPCLSLEHIMQVCCYLTGGGSGECVWSEKDWDMITGADRPTTDTPSWLKLPSQREHCVYISNLPGNATVQKLESMLEMDADCNIDETCLMKDPVTRSINGVGWCVMSDGESVQKAVQYFNSGEAKIFGQAIMLSVVNVKVDNDASSLQEKKALEEREIRMKQRAKEDAAHKTLIINTTEASWKRHAYRLAHPAYADGRIW